MTADVKSEPLLGVADALEQMAKGAREREGEVKESPAIVVVLVGYASEDEGVLQLIAGPGYTQEAHMHLLGRAGLEVAKALGVPIPAAIDNAPRIARLN